LISLEAVSNQIDEQENTDLAQSARRAQRIPEHVYPTLTGRASAAPSLTNARFDMFGERFARWSQ
jgi:hypothetical protein